MMIQYLEIKEKYKDAVLFYRIGDFYEMFYEDAKLVSRELELTLTGHASGEEERAPMCGVPYHAADTYIGRLVNKGYKVVVCEQMEDPALAKGLVKRDIVRVVTPGTMTDNTQLDDRKNNFIVSVFRGEKGFSAVFADLSTGEMSGEIYPTAEALCGGISAFSPSEAITAFPLLDVPALEGLLRDRYNSYISEDRGEYYLFPDCLGVVSKIFGRERAEEIRETHPDVIPAAGALLRYMGETQLCDVKNVRELKISESGDYLVLDTASRRNLELCGTMRTGEKRGSLLWVLDKTKSSAGARMLRRWLEMPLCDVRAIKQRQRAVDELYTDLIARDGISEAMRKVNDLERPLTKLTYGSANARDLVSICRTAEVIPEIKECISPFLSEEMEKIRNDADDLGDIRELISRAIVDEPPFSIREGGFIREGYNREADELRLIVTDSQSFLDRIVTEEREKTGIKGLKISHNKVFGYYMEVSNSQLALVPDRYIRKQTLVGGERFITEELKELESRIGGAQAKLQALEGELFEEIRTAVVAQAERISRTSAALARLDCYCSLAEAAAENSYVCPEVEYSTALTVKEGRHPVVEKFVKNGQFIPNDTTLDTDRSRFMVITGPNMAGKSTYMRQVALITVMAQIGSFVPAAEARIGVCDRIFTRVGASDDLASGTSTFMLEMNEVANILKNATKRSLIVYDEIGRGTSTFDGMSIAQAVAEYTVKKIGCKTMFATHYHELTGLEGRLEGVVNYNIAAKKKGEEIIFLRKILRGGTDDSYGIEVARLAGVPKEVVKRAKEVLRELETANPAPAKEVKTSENVSIEDVSGREIISKLEGIDLNITTPMDAMMILNELKKMAENR